MQGWVDRRLRKPLTASIPGGKGLQDAMVTWIDFEIVHVLTRERLPEGRKARLYLEVENQGRMVELELDVQEISRPGASATRGWLHRCGFRAVEEGEGVFLESCMPSLNPAARKPTSWATASKGSGASSSRSRSRAAKSKPSTSSLNSGGRRRRRAEPPEAQLSPGTGGGPPNLLLRFSDAAQLAAVVRIEDPGFWARLELEASLPVGSQLYLALQLPTHQFVQGVATIETSHGRFYELKAQVANPGDLQTLQRALGDGGNGNGDGNGKGRRS